MKYQNCLSRVPVKFTVNVSSRVSSFGNLLNLDFVTFLWHRQQCYTLSFRHQISFFSRTVICMYDFKGVHKVSTRFSFTPKNVSERENEGIA